MSATLASVIADTDQADFERVLSDLKSFRFADEALEMCLKTAYMLGRKRGYEECGTTTIQLLRGGAESRSEGDKR